MRKFLIALALPLLLAACGGAESIWATDAEVQQAVEPNTGPTSISLMTVISTRSGSGAHSGLIINASQKVMYDPAGTFRHPNMPERNDLHYGLTDTRLEVYIDYHARVTFDVVIQTLEVSPEIAELIFQRAKDQGASPKAYCASSISNILRGVPGFESIGSTMFPVKLMKEFGKLPGVTERIVHDDDADDNRYVLYVKPEPAN